jgi:hypothetical protein
MTGLGRFRGAARGFAPTGIAAAAIAFACGCTVYRPVVTRPPTLGEELIQLDAARRDGLLTQAEHDRRRAATIAAWKRVGDAPIEPLAAPN